VAGTRWEMERSISKIIYPRNTAEGISEFRISNVIFWTV
jgi:hypothetical protein